MSKSFRRSGAWLLFLAGVSAGEAALPASPPLVVRVQRNDYPPEALEKGLSGNVPIQLQIAPNGQVRCEVTSKAGPEILRKPSCALVTYRWPFAPSLDASGKPQAASLSLIVTWAKLSNRPVDDDLGFGGATPISPENWLDSLYRESPSLTSYRGRDVLIHFDVTAGGEMHNCLVQDKNRGSLFTELLCPVLEKHALLLPAVDSNGRTMPTKGTIKFTFG